MPPLSRVLEPEVMDSAQEATDYDAMDHAQVNRVFVEDFLTAGGGGGWILDVGTGTAQVPIELCRRQPQARVAALDAAEAMLALRLRNLESAGLAGQITLHLGDARALPFPSGTFAAVMSNSIVHHIPRPLEVLAEMVRVLAPAGLLFVRDLLRPVDTATLHQLVALYAAGANDRQRQLFADSLHAALTLEEVREMARALGCDPAGVTQTSDRHWTWLRGAG